MNGEIMRLGLLGQGIGNSRQPRLMHFLGQRIGLRLQYDLLDVGEQAEVDLMAEIDRLKDRGFQGINVTHPFKQSVVNLVERHQGAVDGRIGSYNTLRFAREGIIGANTDYSGFKQGYRHQFDERLPGRVLLCGAGGVGRAIALALVELGATELYVVDVIEAQAAALCTMINSLGYIATPIGAAQLPEAMINADGLVNCTALGMHQHPGCAFPTEHIGGQRWAFDAVYTPLNTCFLAACRQAGLAILSGFDLWLYQGLDSFRILTGQEVHPDRELIDTAFKWMD